MITIGITGGIGSGKSLVCDYLEERYHACILKADDVGHEVMEQGGCAYEAVKELFGEEYIRTDGSFDRKKIGDRVFTEPEMLQKLNAIIHPAVHETILERARAAKEKGCELCVIESAILIEADYRDLCFEYWYVHVPKEIRTKRLMASRDITEEKIENISKKQLSEEDFRTVCEFELENGSDFSETKKAADERIKELRLRT